MQLSREQLEISYRLMKTIRTFEEKVHSESQKGQIPGSTHLYAGQESVAVGVCMNLTEEDHIISTHRGHGHAIAKGCEIGPMMAEIFGKSSGTCNGKGGSMHIADLTKGMLGANGIVGGGPPIACGAALTAKLKNTGTVSVVFSGDGAANQGTTAESLNLAMVWNLPIVFVIEDNGWGEATSSDFAVAGNLVERAAGYGMESERVDGLNVSEVYTASHRAIEKARKNGGPTFLHVTTERFYGHFNGDPDTYRSEETKKEQREKRDCLKIFRNFLLDSGLLPSSKVDELDKAVSRKIEEAVLAAQKAPYPDPKTLITDVYESY